MQSKVGKKILICIYVVVVLSIFHVNLSWGQQTVKFQGTIELIDRYILLTIGSGAYLKLTLAEYPKEVFLMPVDLAEKVGLVKFKDMETGSITLKINKRPIRFLMVPIDADRLKSPMLTDDMFTKDYHWKVELTCRPKGSDFQDSYIIKTLRKIKDTTIK
jgi:hypothetical protein